MRTSEDGNSTVPSLQELPPCGFAFRDRKFYHWVQVVVRILQGKSEQSITSVRKHVNLCFFLIWSDSVIIGYYWVRLVVIIL
jgi:hypothetical protein